MIVFYLCWFLSFSYQFILSSVLKLRDIYSGHLFRNNSDKELQYEHGYIVDWRVARQLILLLNQKYFKVYYLM